jgi:hypothetical protein
MRGLYNLSASPWCTVRNFNSAHAAIVRSCLHFRYYEFKPLYVVASSWDLILSIAVGSTTLPVTGERWLRNSFLEVKWEVKAVTIPTFAWRDWGKSQEVWDGGSCLDATSLSQTFKERWTYSESNVNASEMCAVAPRLGAVTFRHVRRKSNFARIGIQYSYGQLYMYVPGCPMEV